MKTRSLLPMFVWLIYTLIRPVETQALGPAQNCILLIESDPGLLTRQADQLHLLIDLLPEAYRLGIGFCGQQALLAPQPLTLARRAELHALLQSMSNLSRDDERDWQQLTSMALDQFPRQNLGDDNRLILVMTNGESTLDWSEQAAAMAAGRIQPIVLSEQLSGQRHPLVTEAWGRQLTLGSDLLPPLMQQLGLAGASLTGAAIVQDAIGLNFRLDEAVESFVLMVEHALTTAISLTSPSGQLVLPGSDDNGFDCLVTGGYVCLHASRRQAGEALGWSGEWQLTVPAQADVSLWLVDPVQVAGEVNVEPAGRLITASIWQSGQRLNQGAGGVDRVVLSDGSSLELAVLNDLGLNGDETAGDGVFSALLPDWLHPLAGLATLEMQGQASRSLQVALPAAGPTTWNSRGEQQSLLLALLTLLVGLAGLISLARPQPGRWRLQHRSAAGYLRRSRCGASPVYAGSGRGCTLRLSADAGKRHLRLRAEGDSCLNLEVLQGEPATLVNGEQVFLQRQLQHGDLVQVGDDQLLVEQLSALRVGRRGH